MSSRLIVCGLLLLAGNARAAEPPRPEWNLPSPASPSQLVAPPSPQAAGAWDAPAASTWHASGFVDVGWYSGFGQGAGAGRFVGTGAGVDLHNDRFGIGAGVTDYRSTRSFRR